MTKQIEQLEKAKKNLQKAAAVSTDKVLLDHMNEAINIIENMIGMVEESETEEDRAEYVEKYTEVLEEAIQQGVTDALQKIMSDLEQGKWKPVTDE